MLDTQLDDVPMVLAELGNSRNHKRCKDFKTLLLLGNWSAKLSETTQLRVRPKVQTEKPELSKQSICDAFISSI
ncbi:hypothetical protein T4E_2223 [Trichinella pseudospiralis]|uniref:Uncharacterized protein n=1 Tax=Trichinella pseudospiralis TaxID=6337 RepID=A0A0V0XTB2_TRIPS|nr:hypothetical protein T4E_2223 [Trichinella pseudospiralis]